jgi:hypothetical protein
MRLIIGGLFILLVVGDGLVWIIYGDEAALLGLLCVGTGLSPILIVLIFFWIIDRIIHHEHTQ